MTPKQSSRGGKQRQGGISKQGNPGLRRLPVVGATAVIRHAGGRLAATPSGAWAKALLERPLRSHSSRPPDRWNLRLLRPARLASVALANKTARSAGAKLAKVPATPVAGMPAKGVLAKSEVYRAASPAPATA